MEAVTGAQSKRWWRGITRVSYDKVSLPAVGRRPPPTVHWMRLLLPAGNILSLMVNTANVWMRLNVTFCLLYRMTMVSE